MTRKITGNPPKTAHSRTRPAKLSATKVAGRKTPVPPTTKPGPVKARTRKSSATLGNRSRFSSTEQLESRSNDRDAVSIESPPSSSKSTRTLADTDIGAAIESLNQQMNSAVAALADLALTQRSQEETVIRTFPLDRATAMFQRLVGEVFDEQIADMLPSLVDLYNEMAQRSRQDGPREGAADDFHYRGLDLLQQAFAAIGVNRFEAHPGAPFDPLIHLAVGETHLADYPNGTISETLTSGFRAARGKVIAPAKVKVNRR